LKQLCHKLGEPRWAATQAHRQDLATGRAKNQKEGPKTRKGGTFLKHSIGCMQQPGAKRGMGGTDFDGGTGHN